MKITKSQLKQVIKEELEDVADEEAATVKGGPGQQKIAEGQKNALAAALLDFVMKQPEFVKQTKQLFFRYTLDKTTKRKIVSAAASELGPEFLKGKDEKGQPLAGYTASRGDPTQLTQVKGVHYLIPDSRLVSGGNLGTVKYPTGRPGVWLPYAYAKYTPALQAWFKATQPAGLMELGALGYLRKQLEGTFDLEEYKKLLGPLADQNPSDVVYSLSGALKSASGLDRGIVKTTLKDLDVIQSGPLGAGGMDKSRDWTLNDWGYAPSRRIAGSRPPGITSGPMGGSGGFSLGENKMKITKSQLKQIINEELKSVLNELEESLSDDELRRHIEKDLGLAPGSIKSSEELEQDEKERKEKEASMPRNKTAPMPRRKKPYGGGSKYRPWYQGT